LRAGKLFKTDQTLAADLLTFRADIFSGRFPADPKIQLRLTW